ncbi:MAG: beta-ketoacyl-ACP synthase 3, partial [Gallionella sp.]
MYSKIIGTGSYLPEKTLTNYDLEKFVDTSHDWIVSRSGIHERHIAADNEFASDLALQASLRAIDAAGIHANDIDLVIVATTSPDQIFPSTACILQDKLGITNRGVAFDMQAVCGGFVYALNTADLYIRGGQSMTALVVGTEVFSRLLDWSDRATCVLFGDGAGAVLLRCGDEPGILSSKLHADGRHRGLLRADGNVRNGVVQG